MLDETKHGDQAYDNCDPNYDILYSQNRLIRMSCDKLVQMANCGSLLNCGTAVQNNIS